MADRVKQNGFPKNVLQLAFGDRMRHFSIGLLLESTKERGNIVLARKMGVVVGKMNPQGSSKKEKQQGFVGMVQRRLREPRNRKCS